MVSPTSRRRAVEFVRHEHPGVSVRRTCELVGLPRSAFKTPTHKIDTDAPMVAAMHRLVPKHPRLGYRRIAALVAAEGFKAGRDRVYRPWWLHGFNPNISYQNHRAQKREGPST